MTVQYNQQARLLLFSIAVTRWKEVRSFVSRCRRLPVSQSRETWSCALTSIAQVRRSVVSPDMLSQINAARERVKYNLYSERKRRVKEVKISNSHRETLNSPRRLPEMRPIRPHIRPRNCSLYLTSTVCTPYIRQDTFVLRRVNRYLFFTRFYFDSLHRSRITSSTVRVTSVGDDGQNYPRDKFRTARQWRHDLDSGSGIARVLPTSFTKKIIVDDILAALCYQWWILHVGEGTWCLFFYWEYLGQYMYQHRWAISCSGIRSFFVQKTIVGCPNPTRAHRVTGVEIMSWQKVKFAMNRWYNKLMAQRGTTKSSLEYFHSQVMC